MEKRFFQKSIVILSLLALQQTESANVLGLFAHQSDSHFAVMKALMTELVKRGHNVTVVSSHRINEKVPNYEEIVIESQYDFWEELFRYTGPSGGLQELGDIPSAVLQDALNSVGAESLDHFLNDASVQKIIHMDVETFNYDLIIVDLFYTEALLMLGHMHNCPVIGVVTTNFENYMTNFLDSIVPSACSPIDFDSKYFQDIGFWERLRNIRSCLARRKHRITEFAAKQNNLLKKYFSHFSGLMPSVVQLEAEMSVIFVNNYVPLQSPRPLLFNTIPVGGLHIRPAQTIPWNMKRFLDDARGGAIYINLGNIIKCSLIPQDKLKAILAVFSKLKERILWTCDVDKIAETNIPANVMLQQNVPHTDVLAHPHVKFYIMAGDLLNLQEGIYRNKPMIGIPIFSEQHRNMKKAEELGIGVSLSFFNLTEVSLTWALHKIMYDSSYPITVRQVSTIFRDRPLGPLETSMYWIDYVLRHKGTIHMQTAGIGISWSQLYLFDLVSYVLAILSLLLLMAYLAYCCAFFFIRRHQVNKMYSKLS